jgi:mRNA interferase MazF
MIRRGEIYFADLDPVRGHEQAGTRPVLIVQNDVGNQYSSTTIVAAITSRIQKKRLPVHVEISGKESGLSKDSVILLDQLRTLDMGRLIRRVGQLSSQKMSDVDMGLRRSLALK